MTPLNFYNNKDIIFQHTQNYIFAQIIYGCRRIVDYEEQRMNLYLMPNRKEWRINIIMILLIYGFIDNTLTFMLERIEQLI